MSKFIKLNRVCVPLTLDCDLSCKYCYRKAGRISRIPDFNDLMKEYLGQLDPGKTSALIASGGEPLLCFDKVQELFSYAPKETHKKIMTNGLNLTPEIVKYINQNNIEVWVSHDGNHTKWLRGIDILQEPEIKELVLGIDHLTFSCVCTNKNPDPYQNYLEIQALVDRPFYFRFNAVFSDKYHQELIKNFNYKAFKHGAFICISENLDYNNPIKSTYKGTHCNVLPNGDIVGMEHINNKYGTVLDSIESVIHNQLLIGDKRVCSNNHCNIFNCCTKFNHDILFLEPSEHFCEAHKAKTEILMWMKGLI